jgi:hypothetical protein
MEKLVKNIFIIIAVGLVSCTNHIPEKQIRQAKAQVRTTRIEQGQLSDYLSFSGKTVYLNNNNIVAPIRGYITKLNIKPADKVKKGDELFVIQSRESYALKNSNSPASHYGEIRINAPAKGVINRLIVFQTPVYVDAGSTLCNIVETGSLYASVEIPFEYVSFAKQGSKCEIILPDNTKLSATFSKTLTQMNESSQTLNVLAKINSKEILPENMVIQVNLNYDLNTQSQIIDKNCVLTDALMKEFWVMKLINDTTAVKVKVATGKQNHEQVEIISPVFDKNDSFISEGGYGLGDTVFVQMIK